MRQLKYLGGRESMNKLYIAYITHIACHQGSTEVLPHSCRDEMLHIPLSIEITPMKNRRRDYDQVYSQWLMRPMEQRDGLHAEFFSDELWATGVRLSGSPRGHYEMVMAITRGTFRDAQIQKNRH